MAISLQAPPFSSFLASHICRPSILPMPFKPPPPPPPKTNKRTHRQVRCCIHSKTKEELPVTRRSANYSPTVWDYNFLQSFTADSGLITIKYKEKKYKEQVRRLKQEVKCELERDMPHLAKLDFIDALQRLGLQDHFDMDIKRALQLIYNDPNDGWFTNDLHSTALRFRLLRQHGFAADQDVFKSYMNKKDTLAASTNSEDSVKGLLSLYEASFHGMKGETIMDEVKDFASRHLKLLGTHEGISSSMAKKIDHALELPIHWRPNRLEARWFMDIYGKYPDMNSMLLHLAKLDFNILQSTYQEEVSKLARWWVKLGVNKMNFSRDRSVEHYFWANIIVHEPGYESSRVCLTKIISMITLIDDVYDVFGTLEELKLLTDIIERWDITSIDKLPLTIRIAFLALYNTTNEVGLDILIEKGFNIIPYLRKMWAAECKAHLKEAEWYHRGNNMVTLKEYLSHSVTSVGGPMMLFCCFLTTMDKLTCEALEYASSIPGIIYSSSLLVRLTDDLGTSLDEMQRGDNPKAVECYMNETGTSRDVAVKHIKKLIEETWKTVNKQVFEDYPFLGVKTFIKGCVNLARASHNFYRNGDGHGKSDRETKDEIMSILIQSI